MRILSDIPESDDFIRHKFCLINLSDSVIRRFYQTEILSDNHLFRQIYQTSFQTEKSSDQTIFLSDLAI